MYPVLQIIKMNVCHIDTNESKMEISIETKKSVYFEIAKVDKKVFKCPFLNCKRQFREKGNLRTHIRVHVSLIFLQRLEKDLLSVISKIVGSPSSPSETSNHT